MEYPTNSSPRATTPSVKLIALAALLLLIALAVWFAAERGWLNRWLDEEAWRRAEERAVAEIVRTGDVARCENISYRDAGDVDYRTVCINNIAITKVRETNDPSWCGFLDDVLLSRENCERAVVGTWRNGEFPSGGCEKIASVTVRGECEELFDAGGE